jgi:ribose 5-phosphate isomerase A
MALTPVMNKLKELGGKPTVRCIKKKGDYYITDNGNYIIDAFFGAICNAKRLEWDINMIPGVLENGLFVDVTKTVFVGYRNRVKRIDKNSCS